SFSERITVEPLACLWVVGAVAVVVQAGFGVEVFGAEAVVEEFWFGAVGGGFAEGSVVVLGGDAAGGSEVFADVAIGIVSRMVSSGIRTAVDLDGEQSTDAAGSLQGAAEIESPGVGAIEGVGVAGELVFGDQVPTIVEENPASGGAAGTLDFDDPAKIAVVLVAGGGASVRGRGDEL